MNCSHFHCGNDVVIGANSVTISFTDNPTGIENGERFCFRLCASIPSTASAFQVYLNVNGGTLPLWNKYGNLVYAGELRKGMLYKGYFGDTATHIIVENYPEKGCL